MKVSKRGYTDTLAGCLVILLSITIVLSFVLALYSIHAQYLGALACWTACIAPLQIGISIVLNAVVNKNKAENTGASGEGIRYHQLTNLEEGGPTI